MIWVTIGSRSCFCWLYTASPSLATKDVINLISVISSVQSLNHVRLFTTPWTVEHQASLSITSSWSLLILMSIESVMASNYLILCHPFLLLPWIFSSIRGFSNESVFASGGQSIGASASVLPMNTQDSSPSGWTGWISLQSKGLKSLLQHHTSKALILQHSAFFIVQLSYPYMIAGKNIALSIRSLLAKWCFCF